MRNFWRRSFSQNTSERLLPTFWKSYFSQHFKADIPIGNNNTFTTTLVKTFLQKLSVGDALNNSTFYSDPERYITYFLLINILFGQLLLTAELQLSVAQIYTSIWKKKNCHFRIVLMIFFSRLVSKYIDFPGLWNYSSSNSLKALSLFLESILSRTDRQLLLDFQYLRGAFITLSNI